MVHVPPEEGYFTGGCICNNNLYNISFPYHHHRFKVRFSMLAWVELLSPTAVGSQVNQPNKTTFSGSMITWLCQESENGKLTDIWILVCVVLLLQPNDRL